MIPLPDSSREIDAAPAHAAPASLRLIGNRPLPAPPDADGDSAFDPRRIVNGLKYHWFLFLVLGSLLAGGLGTAAWELLPAKYTTYSVLRVAASEQMKVADRESGRNEFVTYLKTQANLIKNEYVLRAALRGSSIGDTETLKRQDDPARWLEENLVVEFSENSEIVKIVLTGENPKDLADIVNAVQTAYMKEVVQKEQSKNASNIEILERIQSYLEERIKNQNKNVEANKPKKADLPAAPDSVPARTVRVGMADYAKMHESLRKIRVELEVAREAEKALAERLAKIDTLESPIQDFDVILGRDAQYQVLTRTAEAAEKKLAYLKFASRNPDADPDYRNQKEKVDAARTAVEDHRRKLKSELTRGLQLGNRKRLEEQLEATRFTARALELRLKEETVELAKVEVMKEREPLVPGKPEVEVNPEYSKLTSTTQIFEQLMRKISAEIINTQTPARVQEVQKASVPIKKEMKKQIAGTAVAGLLGFAVVGACITLFEGRTMRLFGARELTGNPAVNVIGQLPEITAGDSRMSDGVGGDAFMEAVDQVRVLLTRNFLGKRAQTILIASADAGEGKTTLAGHLAVSLARTDKKTVIVDCNLRQPGLHEHLGLPTGPGVCEVLRGDAALPDVVQATAIGNLSFVAAGAWDGQAQQALGRDRVRRLLDRLRQDYDAVVIDSHALGPVADTLLVGQHCDAILMCARRFVSRKPRVEQAYQRVCELGVPHTGLIFLGEAAK